ncbi:immunity 17 family protein [Dysgonomonas sp. 511]|uniref:immunity 17 family protein n=1 Tax=Dysgonomonas sp. 511 TaxID=2302930 RepID=UPI0013D79F1D|nr:immunity 17 family protein [Dysgonomonas sp. 511]NDV78470.1 hypothetical protein [Dysgonomonas sp. 511]
MEFIQNAYDAVKRFFSENPQYAKLILPLFGFILLLGAIRNWKWIFEDDGRIFNLAWVKYNVSEKLARIIVGTTGAILIVFGVILYFLM